MKIAHFSPLPPQQTGIANYCAELLPHLAASAHVDAYTTAVPDESARLPFPARPVADFLRDPAKRYQYDVCLYHMGDHPDYHEAIYAAMMRFPGIAVLHDTNLHAFYLHRPSPGARRAAYVREMGYAYGTAGVAEAYRVLEGLQPPPVNGRPLCRRIANANLGLIVHSQYARQVALAEAPDTRIAHIPLAVNLPPAGETAEPPPFLTQLPPETILIGSFGYIAPGKRIETILHALAQLRGDAPDFRYILVGRPIPGYDLSPVINELDLGDIVHQTGFVDDAAFEACLSRVHIAINLRTGPTGGEMSATLARLLAHARSVLVSNVGGFAALPDTCVLKIRQDEDEVAHLATTLRRLLADADERDRYGRAARAYVQENHSFPQVARQYVSFIRKCVEKMGNDVS